MCEALYLTETFPRPVSPDLKRDDRGRSSDLSSEIYRILIVCLPGLGVRRSASFYSAKLKGNER